MWSWSTGTPPPPSPRPFAASTSISPWGTWRRAFAPTTSTYNIDSPYPEEFNREAVGIIARYNFAPTKRSRENLLREGKAPETVFVTGNTAIDALKTTVRQDYTHPQLDWAADSRLVVITAHRRENLGEPMHQMFRAIRRIMEEHPDVKATSASSSPWMCWISTISWPAAT